MIKAIDLQDVEKEVKELPLKMQERIAPFVEILEQINQAFFICKNAAEIIAGPVIGIVCAILIFQSKIRYSLDLVLLFLVGYLVLKNVFWLMEFFLVFAYKMFQLRKKYHQDPEASKVFYNIWKRAGRTL